jgi:hypothetical protein
MSMPKEATISIFIVLSVGVAVILAVLIAGAILVLR